MGIQSFWRKAVGSLAVAGVCAATGGAAALLGLCGPFTDVTDAVFCPFVLEIFYLGITTGTTATTFDPAGNVNRLQMAAFLSRTVDGVLKRGSRRASLNQFSTPQTADALGLVTVAPIPRLLKSDGADIWVASEGSGLGKVSRVRASDGALLQTWTGAGDAYGVLVAFGSVIVTGEVNPGKLYRIDPTQAPGAVTVVATNLGNDPGAMTFDGSRIWTANQGGTGSVSIITPGASLPWTVTTVTTGFAVPWGPVFDGTNVWVTNHTAGTLLKLDAAGAILQTVTVGTFPDFPAFDGSNIWVPNAATISVVRASTGAVLATLTGNGLNVGSPSIAFDGQRMLVTVQSFDTISLWKAADLSPISSFSTGAGTGPFGVCSDGINFWISLNSASRIARF